KKSTLAPYFAGKFGDQRELALLHGGLDRIPFDARGEAALRRERELLTREEARGLLDSRAQRVGGFEHVALGRNQAEHNALVARDLAQRLEGAGARVVVFEQEFVEMSRAAEELARD